MDADQPVKTLQFHPTKGLLDCNGDPLSDYLLKLLADHIDREIRQRSILWELNGRPGGYTEVRYK